MANSTKNELVKIVPQFNGDIEYAAAAFRDYFLLMPGANIPVTKVIVTADGQKYKPEWVPGHVTAVLFLLYCASIKGSPSYTFDDSLRELLVPVFGKSLVKATQQPPERGAILGLLANEATVTVQLTLSRGFDLPRGPGRSIRKLIEYAHAIHDRLDPNDSHPLIREAIRQFHEGVRNGSINVMPDWRNDHWPTEKWQYRVREILRTLNIK